MKKIIVIILGLMVSVMSYADNNPFSFINSYGTLEILVTAMNKNMPMEKPGLGICTKYELTPKAMSMYFIINDELANEVFTTDDATLHQNFLRNWSPNEQSYQMIEAVTKLGLDYRIIYMNKNGESKILTVTAADVAKASKNTITSLDKLDNFVNEMNQALNKEAGSEQISVAYDDKYMYFEMVWTDEADFYSLKLAEALDEETKTEIIKESFDEEPLLYFVCQKAEDNGLGFAFKYFNADKSDNAIIAISHESLKKLLDIKKVSE